jgi:DeoR/GlpR family transcriptional regulator of sugar metabolism
MYQEERLLKILGYLNSNSTMSVHNICELLDVSRDTARRDILKLTEQGAVLRTHGGITLPDFKDTIKAYRERLSSHSEEKKNIAKKALSFIQEDEHCFFDVSTVIRYLAESLNKKVTVFTHSLDNLEILSVENQVTVHSIGGCLHKNNRFFYKPNCTEYFDGTHFDVAFLGAAAISPDGLYYDDEEDAFIKQSAIKQARSVIVLAEHQKFDHISYFRGANLNDIDAIITDSLPPQNYINLFKQYDIELILI